MKKSEKKASEKLPTYDQMMDPLFQGLKKLGGSGSIEEVNQKVFEIIKLPDEILEIPHGDSGGQTEVEYRLAWARTYLKKFGVLENSARGIWSLTPAANNYDKINSQEVVKKVREEDARKKIEKGPVDSKGTIAEEEGEEPEEIQDWKVRLRKVGSIRVSQCYV